jgi:hypothetical protein
MNGGAFTHITDDGEFSVVHKQSEQKNDGQWDADKPEKCASTETHGSLLCSFRPTNPRGSRGFQERLVIF